MYYKRHLSKKVQCSIDAPSDHRRMGQVPYSVLKGCGVEERAQIANFLALYYRVAIRLSSKGGRMRMYVADGSRKPSAQEVFIMAQLARDGYVEIGATVLSLQEDGSVKTCCGEHFSSALDAALVYAQRGHE